MSISVTSATSEFQINKVTGRPAISVEQPAAYSPTPSTVVSMSSDSSADEDAKALADFLASGPGPGVTLRILSGDIQSKNDFNEYQKFTVQPKDQANNALRKSNAELVKLQDRIETNRSSMLGKKWDFVLKDQKIEVVNDNLNAKDRQWLENTLNKNHKLVSAVSSFYGAVNQYYDHTEEHPSPTMRNGAGWHTGLVFKAAEQINGKLAVRDMMDRSIASLSKPTAYLSPDKERPFQNSIELAASYFKYEPEPLFRPPQYDMSDAVTAQYFKDNPNEPH